MRTNKEYKPFEKLVKRKLTEDEQILVNNALKKGMEDWNISTPILEERITKLYEQGIIRYGSW